MDCSDKLSFLYTAVVVKLVKRHLHHLVLLSGLRWVELLYLLLPMTHLLIDIEDVSLKVDTLSCPVEDHPGSPSLNQGAKKPLAFELFDHALL